MKNKRTRQGTPCEIARLDFHGWGGQLVNRIKCKVTEKEKGILMILNIQRSFDINLKDIVEFKDNEIKNLIKEMPKPFNNLSQSRDNKRLVSPPLREWKK